MGTRTVRLDETVYERVKAYKHDDETFSEAVGRLIGGPSLLELVGALDEEQVAQMREVIDERDRDDDADVRELVTRFE